MTWDDHEFWNNYADLDLDPNQPLETVAAAPRRRVPRLLGAQPAAALAQAGRPGHADVPAQRPGATSRSSTCSTRASTAPTRSSCPVAAAAVPSGYCPEAVDPARTILGEEQRDVADRRARQARPRAGTCSPTRCASRRSTRTRTPALRGFGDDNWDGYVADRQRVLDSIARAQAERTRSSSPATRTCTRCATCRPTSRTSTRRRWRPSSWARRSARRTARGRRSRRRFGGDAENPHRLFQTNQRGYVRVEVTPESWTSEHLDRGRHAGARAGVARSPPSRSRTARRARSG